MLALCLMLLVTYYAFNYASIIGLGLTDSGAVFAADSRDVHKPQDRSR